MKRLKIVKDSFMKIVVRVEDVVELVRKFEQSPTLAMREVVEHAREGFRDALEHVMRAEIELFLGKPEEAGNKRNGYVSRSFGIKGVGQLELRIPRDRAGRYSTNVIPAHRHYDEETEKDLALLNLAGLSSRTLSQVSKQLLGIRVSAQEVSGALKTIVPAAKTFLTRPLGDRKWMYLYVDGTNFRVRRSTVDKEPTLVVLGVDETGRKSVLSMVQGDKDNRRAWEAVFVELKERGLDGARVRLGIMDGLPGLPAAFVDAFPNAGVARCWVHKARNVLPRVPRRYQPLFQADWDKVAYAQGIDDAREHFRILKVRWSRDAEAAVDSMERDLEALLVHYTFPQEHWHALRTTNPIERVNKEFKRRSRAMEVVGPNGLHALLAFTALRLEVGWAQQPIGSASYGHLTFGKKRQHNELELVSNLLIN